MKTHSECSGSYRRHESRRVETLDGIWEFEFHPHASPGECPSAGTPTLMAVPQAFDATPGFRNRRGMGLYRKVVVIQPGSQAHLEFESVGIEATVFVDGVRVAGSRCSFLPFLAEIPVSDSRQREIVVLADNRFDERRTPLHAPYYDFRQYGGILGSVSLHHTGEVWIKSLRVDIGTPLQGSVVVQAELNSAADRQMAAEVFVDGEPVRRMDLEFWGGRASIPLRIPNPKVWSPQSPHLHLVRLAFPESGDDLQVRIGLRTVQIGNRQILLNDEPLRLAGVNRHELHPEFGSAVPPGVMLADLMILKKMGANFIRGSHYPQKEQFLDLCDELGFLVWEEMLGWQQAAEHFASHAYRAAHRKGLAEMVLNHINHPAVILWGFLNEASTDIAAAREILEESFEIVRLLDPSRPVTYATCKGEADLFLPMADVLCFNTYPGWYGCEEDDGDTLRHIAPALRSLVDFAESREDLRDKPVLISEIGAEGLYGVRDSSAPFYSEDFQAAYVREVDRALAGCPEISGLALWHFADVQTYAGGRAIRRPRGCNNKGLLNEFRQPKLAAAAAAELFGHFLSADGIESSCPDQRGKGRSGEDSAPGIMAEERQA